MGCQPLAKHMTPFLCGLVLVGMVAVASAQEPPKECPVQLQETQISLELLERTTKQERQQAAADLVRWIQRAQQAEQRLAKAPKPPEPAPAAEGSK